MEFLGKNGKKAMESIGNIFMYVISFDLHNKPLKRGGKIFSPSSCKGET